MKSESRAPWTVIALLGLSWAANADEVDFASLLAANTHQVSLDDEGLHGPGADLILRLASDAQFVALGEEHLTYHIPRITTALFRELSRQYGYRYFMAEQDPVMMELMSRPPDRGNLERINALAQRYPMGVTFNSDQELEMLADIGRLSPAAADPIWGCDQAGGVTHILDQLLAELREPGDEQAIAAVESLRAVAAAKEAKRDFENGFFISDVDAATLRELAAVVDAPAGTRAAWLLDVLINGNQVFGYYHRGEQGLVPGYYENNRFREEHLKDLCLAKYRKAAESDPYPKALMKFGSWHIYEGLSPSRVHTIGDFFSNVARYNGREFLSMAFISRPEDPQSSMDEVGFVWPFIGELDPDRFAVIDLRPFRHYRYRNAVQSYAGEEWLASYKEDFLRIVYGYDLIFFIGRSKPATFDVVPAAQ